ncbi:BCCT family transporter [Defluviimonas sp. WL0024]|uniref:BCCT family transporter n=2 Tax=Albidovulum TaxID=205889 RepID=A0ABT3J5Y4_9RHOB|nr:MULTISPECIES: BCCT family transporter [Defluviimonas]MCU9849578.1 BCCT family transporter [Defluviimonas sp. WL0024]MCW3783089.1 BCCT family transporter [Defluviimonas salinarum]
MSDVTATSGARSASRIDRPLFAATGGFILLFCALALFDLDALSAAVDWGFAVSAKYFGLYWQLLLLATFVISLVLCVLPGGKAILGARATPEFTYFQWASMIMCTLLAGGGVFWAAGEPIAHFLSNPPLFGDLSADPARRAEVALAQSFLHWGFLAWAILGSLTTVMLMHYHYDKGLPLAPRTLLYPVFGDKAINGPIGLIADATSVIAVVAGTVGPIGFLGLQVSYGLGALFGMPDGLALQMIIIVALAGIYTLSAVSGLSKGIQLLSKINVVLAAALLIFMLVAGPTGAIFSGFFNGMETYLSNFVGMSMYRGEAGLFGEPGWLGWWTVFFWGWFLGYGPLMAIFVAKVSRGRSIRQVVLMLSIVAPLITNFWFTIIGGTGITLELATPGVISGPFEGFNLPAGLLAITQAMPMGFILSLLFLVLTLIFVATTGDSMSFVVATTMSKDETPPATLRVFWGLAMAVMAVVLISTGSGGIGKLQSFIVVTAVPVSLILLPSLWDALRITLALGRK